VISPCFISFQLNNTSTEEQISNNRYLEEEPRVIYMCSLGGNIRRFWSVSLTNLKKLQYQEKHMQPQDLIHLKQYKFKVAQKLQHAEHVVGYNFVTGYVKQCVMMKLIFADLLYRLDYLNGHIIIKITNRLNLNHRAAVSKFYIHGFQTLVICPLGVNHVSELKECSMLFLSDFNQNWSRLTNFSKTPKCKMFMKICSALPKLFQAHVQRGIFMGNLQERVPKNCQTSLLSLHF
jgi:hypothetical protein